MAACRKERNILSRILRFSVDGGGKLAHGKGCEHAENPMIQTIPDDGLVTEPGAYRMSMTLYHSQCTPDVSISSTGIRAAALKSPHAFWKTSSLNPDRYPPKPESEHLILGKAAHSLILGDEVFEDTFIVLPEDAPNRPTATQVRAYERTGKWSDAAAPGAAFWREFDRMAAGRLLLTADARA
jgi:hypothetical protein